MRRPIPLKRSAGHAGSLTPVGYLPVDSYHIAINLRLWLPFLVGERPIGWDRDCDRVA